MVYCLMWEIIEVLSLQVNSAMQNTSDQGNVVKIFIIVNDFTPIYTSAIFNMQLDQDMLSTNDNLVFEKFQLLAVCIYSASI